MDFQRIYTNRGNISSAERTSWCSTNDLGDTSVAVLVFTTRLYHFCKGYLIRQTDTAGTNTGRSSTYIQRDFYHGSI